MKLAGYYVHPRERAGLGVFYSLFPQHTACKPVAQDLKPET